MAEWLLNRGIVQPFEEVLYNMQYQHERLNYENKARRLRKSGYSYRKIARILRVSEKKIEKWVGDMEVFRDQVNRKISRKIKELNIEKFEKQKVNKGLLKVIIGKHGLYGTQKRMGLTEGCIKYWADKFNIEIPQRKKYYGCYLCKRKYPQKQKKKGKFCNTCVSKIRRLRSKRKAVRYKGGKCIQCGYKMVDNNYAAFEFHHCDDNKESGIGMILNRRWDFVKKELDKCELLCSNCHRICHSDYRNETLLDYLKEE